MRDSEFSRWTFNKVFTRMPKAERHIPSYFSIGDYLECNLFHSPALLAYRTRPNTACDAIKVVQAVHIRPTLLLPLPTKDAVEDSSNGCRKVPKQIALEINMESIENLQSILPITIPLTGKATPFTTCVRRNGGIACRATCWIPSFLLIIDMILVRNAYVNIDINPVLNNPTKMDCRTR
mmetsp:Transcript_31961/g.49032  ORF Transcript_31961/g.49032 Transcript_31961/m.49032 type:complete len:179 (+) Transcript_31961:174-710(+)